MKLTHANQHRFVLIEDGMVCLMHDWIFVRLAPLPEKYRGTIVLPEGETGTNLRLGTVLGYGPGRVASDGTVTYPGVERGEVVVFHRWNNEHKQGRAIGQFLGEDSALIKPRDVLVVLPPGSEEVELA